MDETVDRYNRAKIKMLGDFEKAISDAAVLREAEAGESGDGIAPVREKSGSAGASLADVSQTVVETAGETAAAADD